MNHSCGPMERPNWLSIMMQVAYCATWCLVQDDDLALTG